MESGAVARARQFGCKRFGSLQSWGLLAFRTALGTQQIFVNFEKVWPLLSHAVRDDDFADDEVANQIKTLARRNGQGL